MDPRGIPWDSQCGVRHTLKAQTEDFDRFLEVCLLLEKEEAMEQLPNVGQLP